MCQTAIFFSNLCHGILYCLYIPGIAVEPFGFGLEGRNKIFRILILIILHHARNFIADRLIDKMIAVQLASSVL